MTWKKFHPFVLTLTLAVASIAGCAPQQPPQQPQTATASACPVNFRTDLMPKWMTCADGKANVKWPPNDGFAAAPTTQTLMLGDVIDRFGSEGGTFFSPKGESFDSRAVPYVCRQMDYRIYQVRKPIPVKAGKAAPWFDEPGGAMQFETTEPAYKLLAEGDLAVVTFQPAGSSPPGPQCGAH
jgi:Tuberculosis necrotizing toxin